MTATDTNGKFLGLSLDLAGTGKVRLAQLLTKHSETEIYRTDHPDVVVKILDLDCGKADELSYGPYLDFGLELANFEDIMNIDELRPFVPAYYGANIDYAKKYAYIAMEYLEGQDLKSWCQEASLNDFQSEWVDAFRETMYETLYLVRMFHKHGIVFMDFKPDDIFRFADKRIKFVDLGAMFTPRQRREQHNFVYSATPDHAELVIDSSNVQTGVPPTEASDIFAAGVALFEMATGSSRLVIEDRTADEILMSPEIFLFRDSQIRDVWQACPALKDMLPLLGTQLKERRILFAEFWHLLKGYLANKLADWESLPEERQDQVIFATGTTFISEQLPRQLQWLAGPIAQATVLRSLRIKSIVELMSLLAQPAPESVCEHVLSHNSFVRYLRDLDHSVDFVRRLNVWDTRCHGKTGQEAISGSVACEQLSDEAEFTFLRQADADDQGHKYFEVVGDLEADDYEGGKLTLGRLKHDHFAWLE